MNSSNISTSLLEQNFSCKRHRFICLQMYSPPQRAFAMFNVLLNVLLPLTAVFGNSLFFAAYHQKQSLRSPANTLLLSLAATDFITGTLMQPMFIYEILLTLGKCSDKVCYLGPSRPLLALLVAATFLNLALITLDRYIAVCHSYTYVELVTNSRVKAVLVIIWLCAIGTALSKSIDFRGANVIPPIIMCSCAIFVLFLYFKIYQEIFRLESHAVVALNDPEEARKARERKRAKTVAITLGVFTVCFLPILLAGFFFIYLQGDQHFIFRDTWFLFARSAILSSSSLNVLIYYWRIEEMRKAMVAVITKITRRPSTVE